MASDQLCFNWGDQADLQIKLKLKKAYKSLVVEGLYYDELCNYDIGNGEADDEIYENLKL